MLCGNCKRNDVGQLTGSLILSYILFFWRWYLERLLRGAASWHRTYEDAGTFLGFAFTKRGIRCRAASDAGLRPKNAGILICAMQRSSDAGAASRHHPAYINHEYQQKNWKIKKKSWKICKKKVENAFLRPSKCKSCIWCQNAAPLVIALTSL